MDLNLGDTQLLIKECREQGLLRNQAAYVLATALWETGHTMKPVKEAYWLSEDWRKRNLRYYPWYGRGYVQLTWKENYERAAKALGVSIGDGSFALEPKNSAFITVRGMRDAWFTKYRLSNFITLQKSDFFNARPIVNGDKNKVPSGQKKSVGRIIADYATEYDADLKKAGYGETTAPAPKPETKPRSLLDLILELFRLFVK